jgi:hypothetical protein
MSQVNVKDLLTFARGLVGRQLHTVAQHCPFTIKDVNVKKREVTFVTSQGNDQLASGEYLKETCRIFSRTNSYRTTLYNKHTHGPSYTLALINQFVMSRAAYP